METRTIPELLQVLLDNEEYFLFGLCGLSRDLVMFGVISREEETYIYNFIKGNAPNRYLLDGTQSAYNWEVGEWPPRKEWLEKQIEYSKNFES